MKAAEIIRKAFSVLDDDQMLPFDGEDDKEEAVETGNTEGDSL